MGVGGAPLASDQLAPVCEGGEFLFVPRAQCSLHITCQSWTPSSKLPTASCPLHLIFLGCPHPRLPPRKLSLARIKGYTMGVDALKAPTSDVSQLAGREQGRNQNRQENAAVPCLKPSSSVGLRGDVPRSRAARLCGSTFVQRSALGGEPVHL